MRCLAHKFRVGCTGLEPAFAVTIRLILEGSHLHQYGVNPNPNMTRHADKVYPWEDLSQDELPQSGSRHTMLPPVSDLISMQRNSAEHSIPQTIPQMPGYLDQHH